MKIRLRHQRIKASKLIKKKTTTAKRGGGGGFIYFSLLLLSICCVDEREREGDEKLYNARKVKIEHTATLITLLADREVQLRPWEGNYSHDV